MADAPVSPTDRERGTVIVFAIGADPEHPATQEMIALCRSHGADPDIIDATADPWFAEHLTDARMREHFPLLCVRGGLVGGLDVVRRLSSEQGFSALLAPEQGRSNPRIALSRAAADELSSALDGPAACIRLVVSEAFEHDLAVDSAGPTDLRMNLGGLTLVVDPESASRADGIAIDWIDTGEGHAFRIDNPNRPEPVREVDRHWLDTEGPERTLLVIDVRTAAEFQAEHLDGARLLDADLVDALDKLARTTPLLFYCGTGIRSKKAAERYREQGFTEVYWMKLRGEA